MDVTPFFETTTVIQIHVFAALTGVLLGPFAILRKRRDRLHKCLGYVWVLAMLSVSGTALMIPSFGLAVIGPFGPIHLFVVLTLVSLWMGMRAIFRGDLTAHRAWLTGLYWQGLLLAGLFNFLPGRMVNRMLFPDAPEHGYILLACGGCVMIWYRILRPWWQNRADALA